MFEKKVSHKEFGETTARLELAKTKRHIHCPECLDGVMDLKLYESRQNKENRETREVFRCDNCNTSFKRLGFGKLTRLWEESDA